ncbi:MAG: transglycosylase SLT domain-containing protein [Cyanobacteria bacterium J06632_22]
MWNEIQRRWPLFMLAGLTALSVGMVAAVLRSTAIWQPAEAPPKTAADTAENDRSVVLQLATQPTAVRTEALSTLLAGEAAQGIEASRARYLLASDLLNQGQPGEALALLDGLEQNYPTLAPYIQLKRGQAQAAAGDAPAAQDTWQAVVAETSNHPAAAVAGHELGKTNPNAWQQVVTAHPAHPKAIESAIALLDSNPDASNRKDLLTVIATYGLHHPNYGTYLEQLVQNYGSNLTSEQWQAVGFGYWEAGEYDKAGTAYAKAPASPVNLYRAGRGQQIGNEKVEAIAAYRKLAQTFPESNEAATGLLKLAGMVPNTEALKTLDQVIAQFPDRAAEALLQRADLLDEMGSPESARQARQSILSQYSTSETAAELRLSRAKTAAEGGDLTTAIDWAQQIVSHNADSDQSAAASFWLGKWQQRQGQTEAARQSYQWTLKNHPESYFAWRSAVYLGWDVGDFDSVRDRNPEVVLPPRRQPLPAGSETLQELYLLGQDADAWAVWQTEFSNPQDPTVAEQFTDGVLRLGVGDNLDGIYELSSLAWRNDPTDLDTFAPLKQTPTYWQSVYPFPYSQLIQTWSQQYQLNPMLVTALIRQESRFEANIQSVVGARGLMQVMPATADWIMGQTGETDLELSDPEDNIRLGTWYLDYTHREYNNNSLFAVASYNAGPGNVASWIERFGFNDPDEFVEQIPFGETQNYVESVFGGYWNYLRLYNPTIANQLRQLDT